MGLETATYISQLVTGNPASGDGLSQADDHIRMIKAVLQATFPNANGAINSSPIVLNNVEAGLFFASGALTPTAPPFAFGNEPSLGWYRAAAGKLSLSIGKRAVGNGLVPVGSIHTFPKQPTSGFSNGGVPGTNTEYLECDGSIYNVADFPDLGAFLGGLYGGDGATTFGVPNYTTSNRFLRSRGGALAVGTTQAGTLVDHTHGVSITSTSDGAHTHTVNVSESPHSHTFSGSNGNSASFVTGAGVNALTFSGFGAGQATTSVSTGITATTVSNGAHTHSVSGTSNSPGGLGGGVTVNAGESRPACAAVVFAIKT